MSGYIVAVLLLLVPLVAALLLTGPGDPQPLPVHFLDDMEQQRFSR